MFVWGGDGMVQRCIDALAGTDVALAILPAGTANLFAANLGMPEDLAAAVRIGLHGRRRALDVGVVNGEHFAVMAGTGFDALDDPRRRPRAEGPARSGRLRVDRRRHLRVEPIGMRVDVDGHRWFEGEAACVLLGNVGTIIGGITAFDDARPDDGRLEVGVVTAEGPVQWARVLARMALSRSDRSPLVETTRGPSRHPPRPEDALRARRRRPQAAKRLKVRVEPAAHHGLRSRSGAVVSTATVVPETWELSGDDAIEMLRNTGRRRLVADAFQRMRLADGFSHARSLAFMTSLVLVQGPSPSSGWPPRSATAMSAMPSSAPSTMPCPVRPAMCSPGRRPGPAPPAPPSGTWPSCSVRSARSSAPPRPWVSWSEA